MKISTRPYGAVITKASLDLMQRFMRTRDGVDNVHPSTEFENCLRGKIAEAAWAILLGHDVETTVLDDPRGTPDLTANGWKLDSKAGKPHARTINVRAEYLTKPDLDRWQILAATVDVDDWTADLIGALPGARLHEYEVRQPAHGHSTGYLAIPLHAFDPAVVKARETA